MAKYLDYSGVTYLWEKIKRYIATLPGPVGPSRTIDIDQQQKIEAIEKTLVCKTENDSKIYEQNRQIKLGLTEENKYSKDAIETLKNIVIEHEERFQDLSSKSEELVKTTIDIKRFYTGDMEDQKLYIGIESDINPQELDLRFVKYSKVLYRPNKKTVKKYYGIHTIRNISSISSFVSNWGNEMIQLKISNCAYSRNGYNFYEILGAVINSSSNAKEYVNMLKYINTPHNKTDGDYFLPINYKNSSRDYIIPGEFLKHKKCGIVLFKNNKIISSISTFRTQYSETKNMWRLKVSRGS